MGCICGPTCPASAERVKAGLFTNGEEWFLFVKVIVNI